MSLKKRPYDRFYVTDETKALIREIAPYWKGRTHEDRVGENHGADLSQQLLTAWDPSAFRLNDVLL